MVSVVPGSIIQYSLGEENLIALSFQHSPGKMPQVKALAFIKLLGPKM